MTRILIVDEDVDVLRLLRVKLAAVGYEVNQARDGGEALELVGKEKPDIVITELLLPDMNGLDLLSQIKNAVSPSPLVMVLTGERADEHISAALYAGAADYISKPFSPQVLLERIRVNIIRVEQAARTSQE